uniref:RRM domain-containing protein n=1 Tax=Mycena chlorophos TaxID=658473 RepID=A0ABQ0KYX9_MYCCL|nr:predicted protein [Mycena chlorophos]
MSKLYIGNLSFQVDDNALYEAFSTHGEITDHIVMKDRETGRSRGFGFGAVCASTSRSPRLVEVAEVDAEDSVAEATEFGIRRLGIWRVNVNEKSCQSATNRVCDRSALNASEVVIRSAEKRMYGAADIAQTHQIWGRRHLPFQLLLFALILASSRFHVSSRFCPSSSVFSVTMSKFKLYVGRSSRGFDFVTMSTPAEAESAMAGLNEQELDGHRLRIKYVDAHKETEGGVFCLAFPSRGFLCTLTRMRRRLWWSAGQRFFDFFFLAPALLQTEVHRSSSYPLVRVSESLVVCGRP